MTPTLDIPPGTRVRVSKGPYMRTTTGKVSCGHRGTLRFVEALPDQRSIRCVDRCGGTVILHISGRRKNKAIPELVCRPYTVTPIKSRNLAKTRRVKR